MKIIKSLFSFLKVILVLAITILLLSYGLIKVATWGTSHFVVKPKGEEFAYDLASYVVANDSPLTEEMLSKYVESQRNGGSLKDNEKISISYYQNSNDHRFTIKVRFHASYFNNTIYPNTATIEVSGVNDGVPPKTFLSATYDEWLK